MSPRGGVLPIAAMLSLRCGCRLQEAVTGPERVKTRRRWKFDGVFSVADLSLSIAAPQTSHQSQTYCKVTA